MIIDVTPNLYRYKLPHDPHPFITEQFISLNSGKTEKIVRLVQDVDKVPIGLVAGIEDGVLLSPFSAPFGGFHYKNESIYSREIENFLTELIEYLQIEKLNGLKISLPPDIYSKSFNTKVINALIRLGFNMSVPEITNWVDLLVFDGGYSNRDSRTFYNQAVKNNLEFHPVTELKEMESIYHLIVENRDRMGRPIFMTFNDLLETGKLWGTDYFKVCDTFGNILAGAIFYRAHKEISYAVFWGDALEGRQFRAMDFLALNLWNFYKSLGYLFIDMGKSTESGTPNEGLLRFKETHECISSLRYSFSWDNNL